MAYTRLSDPHANALVSEIRGYRCDIEKLLKSAIIEKPNYTITITF